MTPRATNLAILGLLLLELASGLGSFLVGSPGGRWVFWLHSLGGLTLVVLLLWKWRVVLRSFGRRGFGVWAAPPIILGLLFLGSLGSGLLWSTVGLPKMEVPGVGTWRGLSLHVALSVVLVPLFLAHVIMRWPRPQARDITGRREALRTLGLLAGGFLAWRATEALTSVASLPGADRRFTGSRQEGSFSGNGFPTTNWLSDSTQRISADDWRLRVRGEVRQEVELSYEQVLDLGRDQLRAVLDCTGGWYSEQRWRGVPAAALLQLAVVTEDARSLVFRSATGYDRRFPLGDRRELLLATHVGGEPISAGHGYPLRLVAPGRRGYHWVKWVSEIEVSSAHPLWQPPLPLQ